MRTMVGLFYLAMVLDVFSRRIVGWMMGDTLRTELVLAALEMAVHHPRGGRVTGHRCSGSVAVGNLRSAGDSARQAALGSRATFTGTNFLRPVECSENAIPLDTARYLREWRRGAPTLATAALRVPSLR